MKTLEKFIKSTFIGGLLVILPVCLVALVIVKGVAATKEVLAPVIEHLPSGLQFKILKAADGKKPSESDTVECRYRATLLDGTEVDDSDRGGQPATLKVNGVIPGLKEALKLMPVGSKWRLFVPPHLAFGARGGGPDKGPNSTIIYEIELLAIR